jgi:hypothetical protein
MSSFKELSELINARAEELSVLKMEKRSEKEIIQVIHELLFLKTKYQNKKNEIVDWIQNNYMIEWGTSIDISIEDLRKIINQLFSQETDPGDEVSNYEEEEDYRYDVYMYSKLLGYKLYLN